MKTFLIYVILIIAIYLAFAGFVFSNSYETAAERAAAMDVIILFGGACFVALVVGGACLMLLWNRLALNNISIPNYVCLLAVICLFSIVPYSIKFAYDYINPPAQDAVESLPATKHP